MAKNASYPARNSTVGAPAATKPGITLPLSHTSTMRTPSASQTATQPVPLPTRLETWRTTSALPSPAATKRNRINAGR